MRETRWAAIVLGILTLTSIPLYAQDEIRKPEAPPKRQGTFQVLGKLVDQEGNPLAGWTVEIGETESGGFILNIGEGGIFLGIPGKGMTNEEGIFRIVVDKGLFYRDELMFAIRTYRGKSMDFSYNPPHYFKDEETGAGLVFKVEEGAEKVDLTNILLKVGN